MKNLKISQDLILCKRELASIFGGAFLCTCSNNDGTYTIMKEDAEDARHCAAICQRYWEKQNNSLDLTNTLF